MAVGVVGIVLLLSTSASLVSASLPAAQLVAQAAPAPAEPGVPGAAPGTARQPSQSRGPAARVEVRISDLHKKLHITPAQEPQFNAFADVMRTNAQSMQDLFQQRAQNRDRTATGMLHWYAQLTTAHADALNKLVPVFDTLYQSLSTEQKKAADAAFQPLRQARPPRNAR
jgi:hypothetical protein